MIFAQQTFNARTVLDKDSTDFPAPMADVLFTQAHKPSAKASKAASRFKSCGIFSSRQWPVHSPFHAGRL